MNINEIMTRDVEVSSPDDTLETAASMMADLGIGVLPVGENDRLVGMVTDRDITVKGVAQGRDPTTASVREIMTEELRYCFEDEDVSEVAAKMGQWQVRRMPILSREKRLVGIVALGDLVIESEDKAPAGQALEGVSRSGAEAMEQARAGNKPAQDKMGE